MFVQDYRAELGKGFGLLDLSPSRRASALCCPPPSKTRFFAATELHEKGRKREPLEASNKPKTSIELLPKSACKPAEQGEVTAQEMIFLVEDEVSLRVIMQKVLQQCGYTIIAAENGAEALELWARHRTEISLVLTDMVLPEGMSGFQLVKKLKADNPKLKVIYTSGFSTDGLTHSGEELVEGKNFVQKPFRRDALAGRASGQSFCPRRVLRPSESNRLC